MTLFGTYTFTMNNYLHFKFTSYIIYVCIYLNLLMICHLFFNVTTLLKRVPQDAMEVGLNENMLRFDNTI